MKDPADKRDTRARFIFQHLTAPVLILVLGFFFNLQLEEARSELKRGSEALEASRLALEQSRLGLEERRQQLDRIGVAHQIVVNALSGDVNQSFVTLRLVEFVLEPEVAKELTAAVNDYFTEKGKASLASTDPSDAIAIADAAKAVGGPGAQVAKALGDVKAAGDDKPRLDKARDAKRLYEDAFAHLAARRFEAALTDFDAVVATYPLYANATEISRLLRAVEAKLDDRPTQQRLLRTIVARYGWRAPEKYLAQLRAMADATAEGGGKR